MLSALYAPIMMLLQTRQIVEILRGQDSGWSPQSRQRAAVARWHLLLRRHWLHMVAGSRRAPGSMFLSLPLLAWMAPALLGLVLALPLSAASGSVILAKVARFLGFFTIPEEVESRQSCVGETRSRRRSRRRCRPRRSSTCSATKLRATAFRSGVAAPARAAR